MLHTCARHRSFGADEHPYVKARISLVPNHAIEKGKMRKIPIVFAVVLGLAAQTYATPTTYDITFNGDGSVASGQIVVDGGVATSGYLDVTAGWGIGDYTLYTWTGPVVSSVRVSGGTDLIVDNLVNVGSYPFLDIYGLAFVSNLPPPQPSEGMDLSLDSGTTYNLGGYGIDGYGDPNADGVATLTAVPDGASTVLLLGFGLAALGVMGLQRNRLHGAK